MKKAKNSHADGKAPKTGDTADVGIRLGVLAAGFLISTAAAVRRKKK